ncbi:peptidase inhibitor clitocypin domain-containing protein [Ceratobasidium sp. AG-Ba]|nr:peptidase inhibitor clitocypin domain-containing protein [Ceratobasidium sp. AG-Ba]
MPELPVGCHITLRYVPRVPQELEEAKSQGGMYACARNGPNEVLEVVAREPGLVEYQKWEIPTLSDEGTLIMLVPGEGNAKELDAGELGFSHDENIRPGAPVTLSTGKKYRVEPKHESHGDVVVFIRPLEDMENKDRYVGVSRDNRLEIQEFPPGTSEGLPGWLAHASH